MTGLFGVSMLSAALCVLSVLVLRPLALRHGLLDRPGGRKWHHGEIPLVGGIAISVTLLILAMLFAVARGHYLALMAGITILTVVGVVDDLRGIAPVPKLCAQLFAAILMTSWGNIYITSLGSIVGQSEVLLHNFGIPLTIFAVVAVINAINMVDGMDGLAGGLALIVFAWMAYLAALIGNPAAQWLSVVFCGALFGFLFFNMRNPLRRKARVFLGDAGSLMLGYGMVWFAVELSQGSYNSGRHVSPVVMLWVMGFILMDLLVVVVRRLIKRRNPLLADRSHLHHILLRMGIPEGAVVWLMLSSNALLGFIGVAGWQMGLSDRVLFLGFMGVTLIHLLVMRSAWRVVRFWRRFFLKTH